MIEKNLWYQIVYWLWFIKIYGFRPLHF